MRAITDCQENVSRDRITISRANAAIFVSLFPENYFAYTGINLFVVSNA
jgi:hypothetical protein